MGSLPSSKKFPLLKIRRARASDAKALSDLNYEFNQVRMKASVVVRKLHSKREIVLVALFDRVIVGFACGQIYDSVCYPQPQAELTELFVRREFRRNGIATQLCRMIETEAGLRKAVDIHLLTNRKNSNARALYGSLGYRAKNDVVHAKDIKRE